MSPEESSVIDQQPQTEAKFPFVHDPQHSTVNFFTEHGLDLSHGYTKSELRRMGWAMYNRVGDGQVPIVKLVDGEDTRMDALLTQEQLERHKKESLPEGLDPSELANLETDMNKFMNEVQKLTYANDMLDVNSRAGAWMNNHINHFIDDLDNLYPQEDVTAKADELGLYFDERGTIVEASMDAVRNNHSIPDNVREIPMSKLARRGEGRGVFGHPCPCMDCDHVFPATDGIKIFDREGSVTGTPMQQIRMNVITTHLAGHGVNDNENQTVDRDHSYMTLRQYMPIYEKRGWDDEHPEVTDLEPFVIEQEVLRGVLKDVREKLGLEDKFSDEELERTIRKYLHLPEPEEKKSSFQMPEVKVDEEGINELLKNVTVRAKVEADRTQNQENKQKYEHIVDVATNGRRDDAGNVVDRGWMTQEELDNKVESYLKEQADKVEEKQKQAQIKEEAKNLVRSVKPLIDLIPEFSINRVSYGELRVLRDVKTAIEAISIDLKQDWRTVASEAGASDRIIQTLASL